MSRCGGRSGGKSTCHVIVALNDEMHKICSFALDDSVAQREEVQRRVQRSFRRLALIG